MEYDVVLLTEKQYVSPTEIDWYVQQVLDEDQFVKTALEARGLRCTIRSWDDPDFDWNSSKFVLFRTIWDYFHRYDEFRKWMDLAKTQTQMINSFEQILWNVDKHYLGDLERKGIQIVPTHYIEKGTKTTLAELHDLLAWNKTVLKPCISGAARHTYLLDDQKLDAHEEIFQELITQEAMMLQPFMEKITSQGEVSHMVMGGKYTHSIHKKAKAGDYRVQDDFGGSVHPYTASQEEIEYAEAVIQACSPIPAYARVDVVWDNQGELALGELELIEPELWFRHHPEAANELAEVIVSNYFH